MSNASPAAPPSGSASSRPQVPPTGVVPPDFFAPPRGREDIDTAAASCSSAPLSASLPAYGASGSAYHEAASAVNAAVAQRAHLIREGATFLPAAGLPSAEAAAYQPDPFLPPGLPDPLSTFVGSPPWRPIGGHPPHAQQPSSQQPLQQFAPSRTLPGPEVMKAHRGLYAALDEDAWLESKFMRSGAPYPAEGELTVVIEYCYNSGESYAQLSTKHGEARYHEEAELVRQYFLNYHSGCTVNVQPTDFRDRKSVV